MENKVNIARRALTSAMSGSLIVILGFLYWLPLLGWILRALSDKTTAVSTALPFWHLLWRTVGYSTLTAATALLAAYPIALLWEFSHNRLRTLLTATMLFPMTVGLLARNYSWIGMMSSHTTTASLGLALIRGNSLLYTPLSVSIVMTSIFVPYAYFLLLQGLESVRHIFIDSAQTLGAPDWKILIYVILPISFRAALLSFGLIFAMAAGYFVTPNMIGGGKTDFVSNAVLQYVNYGLFGSASALAIKFTFLTFIPVFAIGLLALRRRMLVTGR